MLHQIAQHRHGARTQGRHLVPLPHAAVGHIQTEGPEREGRLVIHRTSGPSQHPHVTVHSGGTMVDLSSRDVYRYVSIPDACSARLADPRLMSPLKTTASSKTRCHVTSRGGFRPQCVNRILADARVVP